VTIAYVVLPLSNTKYLILVLLFEKYPVELPLSVYQKHCLGHHFDIGTEKAM